MWSDLTAHPISISFRLQLQNSSLAVTFGLLNAFTALQPESLKVTVTDFFHRVTSITALREAWSCSSCTSRCLQTFSLVKRGSWKSPHRQVPAQMIFPSTEYLYTSVQATCELLQWQIFRQFLVFGMMASCIIWNASSHLQSEIKLVEWKKPNSVALFPARNVVQKAIFWCGLLDVGFDFERYSYQRLSRDPYQTDSAVTKSLTVCYISQLNPGIH